MRHCAVALLLLPAVACGLTVAGSGESLDSGGADGAASPDDGNAPAEGSAGDGSAGADASSEDGDAGTRALDACAPDAAGLGAGGTIKAHAAASTPVIDGDLSDWSCAPFFHLTSANGFVEKATTITGDFALSWTPTNLYVAIRVQNGVAPRGSDGTDPYQNDSVELYASKDDTPTGVYRTNDHHFVVDYKGLARDYIPSRTTPTAPAFVSAVKVAGTSYAVEMAISAASLGHATFSPMKMKFDVELNQSNGSQQVGILIYYEPTGVACGACTCGNTPEPSCNTQLFAELELVP